MDIETGVMMDGQIVGIVALLSLRSVLKAWRRHRWAASRCPTRSRWKFSEA